MKNSEIAEMISLRNLLMQPLEIPFFQRPYSWSSKQVRLLLNDILEAKNQNFTQPYMMGSVITHQTNSKLEIVDGQQRLSTLTLILHYLDPNDNESNSGLLNQIFNHEESYANIQSNYHSIIDWFDEEDIDNEESKSFLEYLNNSIQFVIIKAPSYDDAFVFFDSQNSRGKPLDKTDILKAHHLRFIDDKTDEDSVVAKECVRNWEIIDSMKNSSKQFFLNDFMEKILGRGRSWIKGKAGIVDILEEFKSQLYSTKKDGYYSLNNYNQPPIFKKWVFHDKEGDENDELEVKLLNDFTKKREKNYSIFNYLKDHSREYLPLQITQSLEGGEQFFWYVQKYQKLYSDLFIEKRKLPSPICHLYENVIERLSFNRGISFLKQIFEGSLVFYFDKFGDEKFSEFALWLEHALFLTRYSMFSVGGVSVTSHDVDPSIFGMLTPLGDSLKLK